MVYKIEVVERDVRIAIDENKTNEQLINDGDIDTLSLNDIIRSKIVEAVQRVESTAPAHFLEEGHLFGRSVYWETNGSGWTLLPDDFMRLIAFRMSDWERTCYTAIYVNDPLYDLQSSRYKGIRGNTQKPVCAIVNRPEGKALEFYSCKKNNAYVQRASYIPYPMIDEADGIDISERCYTAVIYTTAALVLTAYGANERAAAMSTLAKTIFDYE
jgi:hypothetical protein